MIESAKIEAKLKWVDVLMAVAFAIGSIIGFVGSGEECGAVDVDYCDKMAASGVFAAVASLALLATVYVRGTTAADAPAATGV